MKKLSDAKKSILGNMIIRQTMGGIKKEDRIKDKDELKERINKECEKQDSRTTGKVDLTMLDVSLVEDMCFVFIYYEFLESIDVSNWDVINVKDMHSMFEGCESLESIDVSKWDVRNIRDIKNMFNGCKFDYKLQGNKLVKI